MKPTWSLRELLAGIVSVSDDLDVAVTGLAHDSRLVAPGDLFFALPGSRGDGREFIDEAISHGAVAVLLEADDDCKPSALTIPAFPVQRLRHRVGVIADRYFASPSHRIFVIGVTGTNGKTTCTQLLAQALDGSNSRCAVIGTLGYGFPDSLHPSLHTTPDAITVHRLLADFADQGAKYVCMEVSSHALDQGRVGGVAFDIAVFTNLTRDHLDYHGDMAAYADAKASLFAAEGLKFAVINRDDDYGRDLSKRLHGRMNVVVYGLEQGDLHALDIQTHHDGLRIRVATASGQADITSALFGRFNASNLLAAMATLLVCGLNLDEAAARLSRALPVAGRVEKFGGHAGMPLVVVDYAHTPDALEKVLQALREYTSGRLWCVFGCGGDRDRGKRPEMGRVAEHHADEIILTDDNPRHEPPEQIIADIVSGMTSRPKTVRDRAAAIQLAISQATAEDIVLVAGKGHEDYQQTGDLRIPYSDRQTVRILLGEAA